MIIVQIKPKSLVQYKKSPAIVMEISDKIEIFLSKSTSKRVREKDIILLHQGPVNSLEFQESTLKETAIIDACELLENEKTTLLELTELICDNTEASSVWSVWLLVQKDLYFSGNPNEIISNGAEYAQQKQAEIEKKLNKKQDEADFLARLKNQMLIETDFAKITDIEELALAKRESSILFKKIGIKQTPQSAHRYLCAVGAWQKNFNPYSLRQGVKEIDRNFATVDLPDETRVDLTHLESWAIDDAGNTDPDDAISLDGDKIWVHIADVSALVSPDSAMDELALEQMANSYLPEGLIHMLPEFVTEKLGLGLSDISPAMSVGFNIDDDGLTMFDICLSIIKATRISYKEADSHPKMVRFFEVAERLKSFRPNAISLQFPEVKVSLKDDKKVEITKLEPYLSRHLVMEFMLAAGNVAGRFAIKNNIPFVFATQALADDLSNTTPKTFADMFALRKQMKRSVAQITVRPHDGLGMQVYSQLTSPLRRYFDLLNHQQLRAFLQSRNLLDEKTVNERINQVNMGVLKRLERDSNLHAKCLFLIQNPKWQGEAVIMEIGEKKNIVIIPELALELKIKAYDKDKLNDALILKITKVDLYELTIYVKRV